MRAGLLGLEERPASSAQWVSQFEAGHNGDGKISGRGSREIDHGIVMRALKKIGVDHFELAGGFAEQLEFAAPAPP